MSITFQEIQDAANRIDDITTVSVHCMVETRDAGNIATVRERRAREGFPVASV